MAPCPFVGLANALGVLHTASPVLYKAVFQENTGGCLIIDLLDRTISSPLKGCLNASGVGLIHPPCHIREQIDFGLFVYAGKVVGETNEVPCSPVVDVQKNGL